MLTVPIFGHALLIVELVLEGNHQPLKATLSRNTRNKAHIPNLQQVLEKDWFSRLAELWVMSVGGGDNRRKT